MLLGDGYNYPYGISIFDFEPITGRIHMPPPIHQQFEAKGFVICSLYRGFMIIIRMLFLLLTTILISILMKFCIMLMVIL